MGFYIWGIRAAWMRRGGAIHARNGSGILEAERIQFYGSL